MPFIKTSCPTCKKPFESVKEFNLSGVTAHFGKCGHILKSSQMQHKDANSIVSLDGKRPFKFQAEGVDFLETANGRALIADEMGLGKTVQALIWMALHPEAGKFLMILKKSLTTQWQHEVMRWIGEDEFAQIISDSRTDFLPFAKYYIISYDLLPEFDKCPKCHHKAHRQNLCNQRSRGKSSLCACDLDSSQQPGEFQRRVERAGIKTIIIDECQQIKNSTAQRTIAVKDTCKLSSTEHIIALSGTPIKNRASEYFTVLNILHPEIFSNEAQFIRWWCQSYYDGYQYKTGGLANPKLFQEKTKSFIIRREYNDIKDQLPSATEPITRRFSFHELSKEVEKAYIEEVKKYQADYFSETGSAFERESNILAYLTRMRRLAGLSLIDPCIDHVMEFLGSTDRKMIIFVHHHDVAEILQLRLGSLMKELELVEPLRYEAGDNGKEFVNKFRSGSRVAIISTLAGGEGLDGMQEFCSDLIMLERQWNPANEEQPEKRISQRIGQTRGVIGTYFIAVGTVVEFFSKIVEQKREYVVQALGGEAIPWDESSLMKELGEILAIKGGQHWGF